MIIIRPAADGPDQPDHHLNKSLGRCGQVFTTASATAVINRLVHQAEVVSSGATLTGSGSKFRSLPGKFRPPLKLDLVTTHQSGSSYLRWV
jgi:hypothetical protein